jgi:hypothetical protein
MNKSEVRENHFRLQPNNTNYALPQKPVRIPQAYVSQGKSKISTTAGAFILSSQVRPGQYGFRNITSSDRKSNKLLTCDSIPVLTGSPNSLYLSIPLFISVEASTTAKTRTRASIDQALMDNEVCGLKVTLIIIKML